MNPSKQKGSRLEREFVTTARFHHLDAWRVPLSGSARGFKGDVRLKTGWGRTWIGECKSRANGFKQLYKWLDGSDFLILKADRKDMLVVMKAEDCMGLWQ